MTRQDLIDILRLDGTQKQIEKYVEEKELTEQERDRIYDFLRADDEKTAKRIFKEILNDITSKPVFETVKEHKQGWRNMRVDLANQIEQLKIDELACKTDYEKMQESLLAVRNIYGTNSVLDLEQAIEKNDWDLVSGVINDDQTRLSPNSIKDIADAFNEQDWEQIKSIVNEMKNDAQMKAVLNLEYTYGPQIKNDIEKLSIKTKQYCALGLMHTNARREEKQVIGKIFMETTQPFRETLAHSWKDMSERIGGELKHVYNLTADVLRTGDLNFYPIRDKINRRIIKQTKPKIKNLNRVKSKIQKAEQKIIKKANKISKKEFRKNELIEKMSSWSKGVQLDVDKKPEKPELINDIKKAESVLGESQLFSDKKLELMQYNLDKLRNEQKDIETSISGLLDRVKSDIMQRREHFQKVSQDVAQKMKNGEYVNWELGMKVMDWNTKRGYKSNFISERGLSDDLKKFMKEHGYDNLIATPNGWSIDGNDEIEIDDQEIDGNDEIEIDDQEIDGNDEIEIDDQEIGDR